MLRPFLLFVLLLLTPSFAWGQRAMGEDPVVLSDSQETVKTSTTLLCLVPSAAGLATALVREDWEGVRQLALSSATALAANYALELTIHKDRPDGTEHHSMPSTHTLVAFSGASFIQRRYGWQWGIPAYALSTYVAWGRVYSKRHDVWDVLVGAGIGVGATYLFTRSLSHDAQFSVSPIVSPEAYGMHMALTF